MEHLFVKLVDQGVPAGRGFIRLLNMSVSAAVLIVAVVLVRLIFRKAPKWTRAILWAIVALRLVCPVMISSPVSVYGLVADTPEAVEYFREDGGSEKPLVSFDTFAYSAVPTYSEPADVADPEPVEAPPQQVLERKTHSVYLPTAVTVWLIGVCAMLLYMLVSFLILRLKVRASVDAGNGVRVSDGAASPFILGVFRPRIYMPSGMSEVQAAAALAHEREHIRRGDHVWKLLGFLLLAVHWFNPLVWLAYVLFGRDVELICDERVVRSMDAEGRADYSQALLDCSARRTPVAACPLAFGESGVKARIKSVLNYKKPALWIVIAVIVVCAAVAVCFLTSPSGKGQKLHPDLAAHPEGYVVSSREEIRPSYATVDHLSGDIETIPDTLEGLAQKCNVAVKARLTAQDMLDPFTTEYTFTLLEDYFGTAEETMNLYTLGSDFFEVGGVYYLFMRTFDTTAWPHLNYGLSSASFAVREYLLDGETVLVYRTELTYGMDESTDMSAELKKLAASMKRKGAVPTPLPTSPDDVLSVASVVEIVTVKEALYNGGGANRPNKYVVKVNFTVDQLVWGTSPVELKDVYASAPYGTQVGDRLVVIFGGKLLTTEFSPLPHHVYAIDSEEAQTILKYFGVEVSQPTPTPSPDEPAPLLTVTGANGSFAAGETPSWERTWTDDGWLYADGWPWYFDVAEKPEKAPTVYMTDNIELTLGGGVRMSNLVVYSEDFTPLREDWYGDTALNWLEPGTYYCSVQVAGPRGKYVPSEDAYEESVSQCFFRLVVTEQGPAPAAPSEIRNVTLARMTFWDREVVISDPAVLARLESLLGGAEDLGYASGCPFGSVLTLTRADGREFSLCPAEDSCGVFFAGGNYYKYPGDNEEFWALVQGSEQNDRASMDASQIFRGLPSNVENAVTGTVTWPRNAQTYGTSYDLKLSENEIRTLLNIGDSSPERVLNVSDRYLRFYLDNVYYDALTSAFPYSPFVLDSPGEQRSGHSKADYPPRDLAFMPISEAVAQVYSTLADMGITGLELEQACALDAETLTRDLKVYADQAVAYGNYNSVNDDGLKQLLDVSFGEDNECYFFSFRLRIGGDAVLTAPASDQELDFSGAMAYCLYGPAGGTAEQPGLVGLIIRNMPTGVSERGEQPVISPDKAAEAVVPLLNEGLKDARFVAAEFRYCYLKRDGRPVSVLRPTWVFTLAYPVDYPFAGSQITTIRYYAVDAITGEVLTRS
jgi:beta-lactamase regulating signal transducer with metallopeptidase domain